jgi:3-mercaptopyruvate sulfurtransferase SseA
MVSCGRRFTYPKVFLNTFLIFCVALSFCRQSFAKQPESTSRDPWNKTQLITPKELAALLSKSSGQKPLVVCVGFDFLYKGAHIPGAQFLGPGREAKGIKALKNWAGGIPRGREVVLYCGCCPFKVCPNIRPAFQTLREAGLKRIKVLYLEYSFAKDWVEKGLPVEKEADKK